MCLDIFPLSLIFPTIPCVLVLSLLDPFLSALSPSSVCWTAAALAQCSQRRIDNHTRALWSEWWEAGSRRSLQRDASQSCFIHDRHFTMWDCLTWDRHASQKHKRLLRTHVKSRYTVKSPGMLESKIENCWFPKLAHVKHWVLLIQCMAFAFPGHVLAYICRGRDEPC